uniref:Major facilitator superfamily (MFS) profile domain-containing protein n=1 Tax=Anguilla anguilla TaxID=7936 RepID=A0A0E9V6A1_ANGAN
MYQATVNIGFLVGSIAIGYLADRFGRKMSFLLSNLWNAVAGILVAIFSKLQHTACVFEHCKALGSREAG